EQRESSGHRDDLVLPCFEWHARFARWFCYQLNCLRVDKWSQIQFVEDIKERRAGNLLAVADSLQFLRGRDDVRDEIVVWEAAQEAEELHAEIRIARDRIELVEQQDEFHTEARHADGQLTDALVNGRQLGNGFIKSRLGNSFQDDLKKGG